MSARKAPLFLLPILVLCPAAASGAEPPDAVVARVGAESIHRSAVVARAQTEIAGTYYHRAPSKEEQLELLREALNDLVDETLLGLEARRRGLTADPEEVERRIDAQAEKMGGRERFAQLLARRGRSLDELRAKVAAEVLVEQLLDRALKEAGGITDAEARAYHAANADKYVMPLGMHVRAALVMVDPSKITEEGHRESVRVTAEKVAAHLRAGKAFSEIEAPRTEARDLGWIHEGALVDELGQAVTDLDPGEVTDPVPTTKGWYVAQLVAVRPPEALSFEQVSGAVRAELRRQRREALREKLLKECRARWPVELLSQPE